MWQTKLTSHLSSFIFKTVHIVYFMIKNLKTFHLSATNNVKAAEHELWLCTCQNDGVEPLARRPASVHKKSVVLNDTEVCFIQQCL